ncbi:hypothetical protein D3C75_1144540 [compost metagenome]
MRAAIPEQLHHFDLARHSHRNGAAQFDILFTGFKRFSSLGGDAEQAGSDECGAENQITHALLLGKLARLARPAFWQAMAGISSLV